MKRLLWIIVSLFLSIPAAAQDGAELGGFFGGDGGDLLSLPAPTGNAAPARGAAPGNRGAAPARGVPPGAPPVDRLLRLRDVMSKAGAPLTAEQETALNALLNVEIPAMRRALQARILELQREKTAAASASQPEAPSQPPPDAGQRGAGQRGLTVSNLPTPEELAPDIQRLNDDLLRKVGSASTLSADQRAIIEKLQKDQIRARGGFDALNLTMTEAGAPFTPEQAAEVRGLFDRQNQARAQLPPNAAGTPDAAAITQLERQTLAQVIRLLTDQQRRALAASISAPRP
jgi:hypothetical protein